jgi:hypothetical protein
MKFKVMKGCVVSGQSRQVGEIVDIQSADELKTLMGIGRVVPHDEPVIEDRSLGLDDDTKPRRRGRPKKVD